MQKLLLVCLAALSAAGFSFGFEPTPAFTKYIEHVEGFRATPYIIGGLWHIGYGHQIKKGEVFACISQEQGSAILSADLQLFANRLRRRYSNIEETQLEILIDFAFNGCDEKRFPKFYAAVLANNASAMAAEYKRHANGKELTGRNRAFAERYLCKMD